MSLISLLIALSVERYLPSSNWQFITFYQRYLKLASWVKIKQSANSESHDKIVAAIFVIAPALLCYLLMTLVDSNFFNFILSTLVLIVCLGCSQTRASYKNFLKSAFRGESKTCDSCQQQLATDKNLPGLSFGQMLIWLNYRYFIAIMFFFVLLGAPGAILYRLLVTLDEVSNLQVSTNADSIEEAQEEVIAESNSADTEIYSAESESEEQEHEIASENIDFAGNQIVTEQSKQLLSWIDWILIRVVAFGYMLVGHFSRALPTWLEYVFNAKKPAYQLLIDVAEQSEDIAVDEDDCSAEPCILVRLAKRTLLLCLVVLSLLIMTGVLA